MRRDVTALRGAGGGSGKGGGGGATRVPTEAPDSLRSRQFARVIDLVAEGEIEGLVDGLRSVFLDDTPIQNLDGTFNFSGVSIVTRPGTQAQSHIEGFPAIESEVAVSTRITDASPVVRALTNTNLDAARVTVSVPQLTSQNPSTGDLSGTSVEIAIDVQTAGGGFVEVVRDVINGKTTSRYQRSYRVALPDPGPWDIRVRRITPDSTSATLVNQTWWDSYTEIIDAKLRYPNSALVALSVDAAQFRTIPRRGYDVRLLRVRVPTNYDPITRVYSGVWDGTFKIAWTDNPSWAFFDLIASDRYGLGAFVDVAQIDKWALFEIAQYCDELVEDGFGGFEPRFRINAYLQTRQEAFTVLQQLASVFRGMAWWSNGTITASQDAPADPVALFTPANVIDGAFNYEGSSARQRHTVALVAWNDPADRFRQKIEYVEDEEGIARFGVLETEIVAFGVTSRGQAHRVGRWLLLSEQLETETVSFRAGLDSALIAPGAIIQVQDPFRSGKRFGGRLVAATTAQATLDAPVTIEAGKTYELSVVLDDGTIASSAVVTAPGTVSVLDVSPAFAAAPPPQAIWVLTASDLVPTTWRVLGINEIEPGHQVEILALAHRVDKFDAVEKDLVLEPLPVSSITAQPATPQNIVATESLFLVGPGVVGAKLTLTWDSVLDASSYEVQWRFLDGGNPESRRVVTNAIEIAPVERGLYEITVQSVNALGRRSAANKVQVDVVGLTAPPANIAGLTIQRLGGLAVLRWEPHPDLDVTVGGQIVVRHSPLDAGATWEASTSIGESQPGNSIIAVLPLKAGTYLVKARDGSGLLSQIAASVATKQATALAFGNLATLQEDDDFLGTHSSTVGIDGVLKLSSQLLIDDVSDIDALDDVDSMGGVALDGTYSFAGNLDLGTVSRVRLTSELLSITVNANDLIDLRSEPIDTWLDFDGAIGGEADAWVEVRETDDDPAGTPIWSEWQRLDAGEFDARAFQFRARLMTDDDAFNILISELRVHRESVA